MQIKQLSNLAFGIAFICAVFMITGKTYGYRSQVHITFFVAGALGLILSLIASRMESYKDDFNVLFWIGNLMLFIGLILKTYYLPHSTLVMIIGMSVSGLSYFFNPFDNSKPEADDELLDN